MPRLALPAMISWPSIAVMGKKQLTKMTLATMTSSSWKGTWALEAVVSSWLSPKPGSMSIPVPISGTLPVTTVRTKGVVCVSLRSILP